MFYAFASILHPLCFHLASTLLPLCFHFASCFVVEIASTRWWLIITCWFATEWAMGDGFTQLCSACLGMSLPVQSPYKFILMLGWIQAALSSCLTQTSCTNPNAKDDRNAEDSTPLDLSMGHGSRPLNHQRKLCQSQQLHHKMWRWAYS